MDRFLFLAYTLEVEQISDHVAFIDRGRLIALEQKEELLERWRRLMLVVPPRAAPRSRIFQDGWRWQARSIFRS